MTEIQADPRRCPERECEAPMELVDRAPSGQMTLWRCVKCGKHMIVANGQEFK